MAGRAERLDGDVDVRQIDRGFSVLIGSDGLWGLLGEQVLLEVVTAHDDRQAACEELIARANRAGSPDNVTVVLARVVG